RADGDANEHPRRGNSGSRRTVEGGTLRRMSQQSEPSGGRFPSTHWSLVLRARQREEPGSAEALQTLCRAYWFPLYAFARREGCGSEEAQDLTQEFFARLLAKRYLDTADASVRF